MQASWMGTSKLLAPMYGTGFAAPVFIKVKVRQALGFEGDSFEDPLLKMPGLNFAALHSGMPPQSDPVGFFREAQMAEKFGYEGTGFITSHWGASQDCRYDPDCKMQNPLNFGSCEVSEVCTPTELRGYMGTAFPGELWGTTNLVRGERFGKHDPEYASGW